MLRKALTGPGAVFLNECRTFGFANQLNACAGIAGQLTRTTLVADPQSNRGLLALQQENIHENSRDEASPPQEKLCVAPLNIMPTLGCPLPRALENAQGKNHRYRQLLDWGGSSSVKRPSFMSASTT